MGLLRPEAPDLYRVEPVRLRGPARRLSGHLLRCALLCRLGLTDDRLALPAGPAAEPRMNWPLRPISATAGISMPGRANRPPRLTAVDQLAFLRRHFLGNARPVIAYRIARWKRRAVAAMLDGPAAHRAS